MEYSHLNKSDAGFLTSIFVTEEYDLYFAENDTTEQDWQERDSIFDMPHSYIVSKGGKDIGWIMYTVNGSICDLSIIVLLPTERHKGYGREILSDLLSRHPEIDTVKLDVQQRNTGAIDFYTRFGFRVVSEEIQYVNDEPVSYYNMELNIQSRS